MAVKMGSFDRLVAALQEARADSSGLVLVALDPEDVGRLIAWLAFHGWERSQWSRGDRARHMLRLAAAGRHA